MASKKPSLVQLPCAKTREFGEAEFSDCLPVSALVCVFAFDTAFNVPKPVIPTSVLALKYSCFVQTPCAKTPEFGFRRILGQYAGILWRDLVLAFGKARQTLLFAK